MSNVSLKVGQGLNYCAKKLSKQLEYGYNNPEKYANAMLVVSLVSKDAVNCYYYTTQSWNNKRIPEEQRKFVAALDLINGIINVGGQILASLVIEKTLRKKLFDGLIAKKLDNDILGRHAAKIAADKGLDKEAIYKVLLKQYGSSGKKFKAFATGFSLLVGFLATTAVTKRLITPFLSTPIAGWVKKKYLNKKNKSEEEQVNDRVYYQWLNLSPKYQHPANETAKTNKGQKSS